MMVAPHRVIAAVSTGRANHLTHLLPAEGKHNRQAEVLSLLQDAAQQVVQAALALDLLNVGSHNHRLGLAQLDGLCHLSTT